MKENRKSVKNEQLRDQTMDETNRNTQGEDAIQNTSNSREGSGTSHGPDAREDQTRHVTDKVKEDTSGTLSGGTVDMGPNSLTGSKNRNSRAGTGSGLNTKRNVTGSDFDGQNKPI